MKLKLIKGGLNLSEEEQLIQNEYEQLEVLLKKWILGEAIHNKIIDISCFYDKTLDDLVEFVNRVGGM